MSAVGFIGLGNQGAPIAQRIADAGLPLAIWARRTEVTTPYAAKGVQVAASAAELGAACRHVGICVRNDAGVLEVCDALIPAMAPGGLIAVHSTILPATSEQLAARCASVGLQFVDAPVSGGALAAQAGTLTVMCGASDEAFATARPVFETFGRLIVLLGPAGSGQRAKLVNNALLSANVALAWAALQAGQALGMDRAALAAVIAQSSGASTGLTHAAAIADPTEYSLGGPLLRKDLDLLCAAIPDDPGAMALDRAARSFLLAATGEGEAP
jgi:3-hydroxyisobutyrate dehydrogenase-like beta-hydroxyacid dehydrogenase